MAICLFVSNIEEEQERKKEITYKLPDQHYGLLYSEEKKFSPRKNFKKGDFNICGIKLGVNVKKI